MKTGNVGVANVPYRVLTSVNECCNILVQKRGEDVYKKCGTQERVKEVEDFEKLIKRRWAALLGKAATKSQKTAKTLSSLYLNISR